MNFRALILDFCFKKFTFFWSHFAHHFISYFVLRAYFYIILTQPTTYLVSKTWSKVFLHTLLHKNVRELINTFMQLFWNFNRKVFRIGRYILKLEMQQLLRPTWDPKSQACRLMCLQTKWKEQIYQKDQNILWWNSYFVMYLHKCKL